jgi:ligand-binding sensor domain-containing protein
MKNYFYAKLRLLILTLLASFSVVDANEMAINCLTVQNGLAGETVFKIKKDTHGIIWIGTSNGLNSFNGYKLHTYHVNANRVLNVVYDISQCGNDIYVATPDGAYVLTDGNSSLIDANPQSHAKVTAIESDRGKVYIGSDDGLYVKQGDNISLFTVSRDRMSMNNAVIDISIDEKHRIWILTAADLYSFDSRTGKFKAYNVRHRLKFIGRLHNIVATKDNVYVGSDNAGLFVYNIAKNQFGHYVNVGCNVITDLSADKQNLYVSTDGNGAHVISLKDSRIVNSFGLNSSPRLQDNSVYCFFHDKTGVNWFGYFRRGLSYNYYSDNIFKVYKFGSFTSQDVNVRSFCIHGSQKVIGTRNGLYFIDEKSNVVKYFPPSAIGGSIVTSICLYRGLYYVATYDGGVSILNPHTLTFSRFHSSPALTTGSFSKLVVSPQNELWMGGNQGIFIFNGNILTSYSEHNSQLYDAYVSNMMFDRQGRCWISTQKGLCIYTPQDKVIRSSGFPSGFVNKVSELNCTLGEQDDVICYSLAGLFRTNEDMTRFFSIKLDATVWNDFISFVIYDKKRQSYWLGTENGLFCFMHDFKNFRHYDDECNLLSKEYSRGSCLIDGEDNLWIGSLNGLVYANLRQLQMSDNKLFDISPDDISIDNGQISRQKEYIMIANHKISLTWNILSQTLSFRPVLLNYGNPDGNYYEYSINTDDKWSVVDDKSLITTDNFHLGINYLYVRKAGCKKMVPFIVTVYPSCMFVFEVLAFIAVIFLVRFIYRRNKDLMMERKARLEAEAAVESMKYSREKMNEQEYTELFKKLTDYINKEKPYLDPSLKLSDLAVALDCSTIKLSQLLNMHVKQNYYDFINTFRLEEFKRRLADKAYSKYTLIALSEQCGFKKSSFFSTFKKMMGITPAEYLHKIGRQ